MTRFDKITQSPEALTDWLIHGVCPTGLNDTACYATLKRNHGKCPYEDENGDTDCTNELLQKCWIAYLMEKVEADPEPDESCESCNLGWLYEKPVGRIDLDELQQEMNSRP